MVDKVAGKGWRPAKAVGKRKKAKEQQKPEKKKPEAKINNGSEQNGVRAGLSDQLRELNEIIVSFTDRIENMNAPDVDILNLRENILNLIEIIRKEINKLNKTQEDDGDALRKKDAFDCLLIDVSKRVGELEGNVLEENLNTYTLERKILEIERQVLGSIDTLSAEALKAWALAEKEKIDNVLSALETVNEMLKNNPRDAYVILKEVSIGALSGFKDFSEAVEKTSAVPVPPEEEKIASPELSDDTKSGQGGEVDEFEDVQRAIVEALNRGIDIKEIIDLMCDDSNSEERVR